VKRPDAAGTAAAAVLWGAALRLAADVGRQSAAPRRAGRARASSEFGPEWDALVGRWLGHEASASVSAGDLVATFDYELDGGVMTHRAHGGVSTEAAPAGLPHEALMTFFPRAGGRDADAVRYDNAGQATRVEATWSDDGRALALTSLPEPGEARWRWTWRFEDAATLRTRLEHAAPGRDNFETRVRGTLRRA